MKILYTFHYTHITYIPDMLHTCIATNALRTLHNIQYIH
jgi:hypothetical protein